MSGITETSKLKQYGSIERERDAQEATQYTKIHHFQNNHRNYALR